MIEEKDTPPEEQEPGIVEATEADLEEIEKVEDDWKDKYLRTLAELDNFRKRTERETEQRRRYALEGFLRELLPVLDALEHAAAAEGGAEAIREGVQLALTDAKNLLKRHGLAEIEAMDRPFDPRFHEAVGMAPDPDRAAGTVFLEERKGYLLGERVLRPSRVHIVIAPPAPEEEAGDE